MNHLANLTSKLQKKPIVEKRTPVLVKMTTGKEQILKQPIINKFISKEPIKKKEFEEGEIEEGEIEEGEIEEQNIKMPQTIIVNNINSGFDRAALLDKLKKNKILTVIDNKENAENIIVKPIIEEQQTDVPLIQKSNVPILDQPNVPILEQSNIPILDQPNVPILEQSNMPILDQPNVPLLETNVSKPKKTRKQKLKIIIEKDDEPLIINTNPLEKQIPKETSIKEKGIAKLGKEVIAKLSDTDLINRLPVKRPSIDIKVSSYYMNNREIFVNFINSLFAPYRKEIQENKEEISCDTIGKTTGDFSLLTHQKIVRDYINLYTPYRGLLLYHGLGSGKTCTSIAIAEGMKNANKVIIMTPASLRANYVSQLKECGDQLYKKLQYWEWIDTKSNPSAVDIMSTILNLPREYINKKKGAWFVNISKPSNYDELTDLNRKSLEEQLNEMITQKYTFINYNGLRAQRLTDMTQGFTKNIFDNTTVIIDEAHNFISRIVNKLKKDKPNTGEETRKKEDIKSSEKIHIFGEQMPLTLATKLYYMLLKANNARIVLLTGTPVINYPNEFGILFNILRGYIKTWEMTLIINSTDKIDKNAIQQILSQETTLDYLEYSSSSKLLTITRNPFGFTNIVNRGEYNGLSNEIRTNFISDDDFEKNITGKLARNGITIERIKVVNKKSLPDDIDGFINRYINTNNELKNTDALKRRILGLSSYFKSAQESLLPTYDKESTDYHEVLRIEMSDYQFKQYANARTEERKTEKKRKIPVSDELFKEASSTYRIFSRLYCNYAMPDRPIPLKQGKVTTSSKKNEDEKEEVEEVEEVEDVEEVEESGKSIKEKKSTDKSGNNITELLKQAKKNESIQDISDEQEGEIEGDQIIENIGGIQYKEQLERRMQELKSQSTEYLSIDGNLANYSPKFFHMANNVLDENNIGLHLVYSQFRTAEGIGIFSLVLEANGFARFSIKKNAAGVWEMAILESDMGKPMYALYTGTETSEEKEIIRHIYNGEWDQIPDSISSVLKEKYNNNHMGEVIKVLMITSSGSEGINLRNTRYVHIMEPYWHPVRSEQVIGRARRICSHKDLPRELQTVKVFEYLMIFSKTSPNQLLSSDAVELKIKDLSKRTPKVPITTDEYLYEISEIKSNLTTQLTDVIKESAFDCYIYSNGKCVNFGNTTKDKFTYVPDYDKQENDTIVKANKVSIEWTGREITLGNPPVKYVARKINSNEEHLYDISSYKAALKNPEVEPVQVGTLKTIRNNGKLEKVLNLW